MIKKMHSLNLDAKSSSEEILNDEDYIIEYDRDIILDKINTKIQEIITKESPNVK